MRGNRRVGHDVRVVRQRVEDHVPLVTLEAIGIDDHELVIVPFLRWDACQPLHRSRSVWSRTHKLLSSAAATPLPSRTNPRSRCSGPSAAWPRRWASSTAYYTTSLAGSVNRSKRTAGSMEPRITPLWPTSEGCRATFRGDSGRRVGGGRGGR
jgi:hypothetical protein